MSTHKDNSSLRYFLASLKPLGKPLFWAPLGLFSLALIFYWQYSQQPALLNRSISNDQPAQNLDRVVNGEAEITEVPSESKINQNKARPSSQLDPNQVWRFDQPNQNDNNKSNSSRSLFTPLVRNNQTASNSNSSLFVPLMPQVRQNSQISSNSRANLQPIEVTPPSSNTRQSALQDALNNAPTSGYNPRRYNSYGNNVQMGTNPNSQQNSAQNRYDQPNSPNAPVYGRNPGNFNSSSPNPAPEDPYQGGYGRSQSQPSMNNNNAPRYGVQPSAIQPRVGF